MLTLSAIKADVGSIGGHTRPSNRMLRAARERLEAAKGRGLALDFDLTHTGDDICLLMVHRLGSNSPAMLPIQELEYSAFRPTLAELEDRFRIVEPASPELATTE